MRLFETSDTDTIVGYAQVATERSVDIAATGLTYAVPRAMADLRIGERVVVPLGRGDRKVTGYVLERSATSPYAKVKPIIARDAQGVTLPADLIELARWIAGYYCTPLGMVLTTMLPAAVKRGTGRVARTFVRPSDAARDETVRKQAKLTKLQRAILDAALAHDRDLREPIELRELQRRAGAGTPTPVKALIDKGMLVTEQHQTVRSADYFADFAREAAPSEPVELIAAQRKAVDELIASLTRGFSVHLLQGVTGSGKTEVYLRVIEALCGDKRREGEASERHEGEASDGHEGTASERHEGTKARRHEGLDDTGHGTRDAGQDTGHGTRDAGQDTGHGTRDAGQLKSALVLVPEIALTPQTVQRFYERFASVAVLHSGLTPAQRHEQWQRIRRGEARIVIGARSAVFAPLPVPGLGVIIVDEEHEPSYKQQDQLPRYHARDVAIKRAQMLGIPIVLGSATPSLESYHNAVVRRAFHLHKLPLRATGAKMPRVDIVDMKEERRKRYQMTGSAGVHLFSLRLEKLIMQTLRDGAQVMLLLNRRGYANYIACPDQGCGYLMHCDYCDAAMVYHKDLRLPLGGVVRCHHCGAEQLLRRQCPTCGKRITTFGLGTQRVEEELLRIAPEARVARMDSDTMQRSADYHQTLERFRAGDLNVLVGTQMIAKGLDFPNVRLVGVISADTALNLPDFRASERTFQLIAQVAGRAGRAAGDEAGMVIVQTFSPGDPAIQLASQHDYDGFAAREIKLRRKVNLPPITRMARIVVRDRDLVRCIEQAKKLAAALRAANTELGEAVRLRGPAPCPIARIAEYHRQQIELIAPDATTLQKLLTALRNARQLKSDAHTAVDVDPMVLL